MKPVHTTLLASAFLAATYVAAPGTANAGGRECMAQSLASKAGAARKLDTELGLAIDRSRTGKSVIKEVEQVDAAVKGEDFAWLDFPNQCLIQDTMEHELDDLHARAAAFRAQEADFLEFQFQVVMGRYERALAEIALAWKNGKLAEDIAQKTMYEMRVTAFDYLESLGVVSIRERLQEAITVVIERGTHAEDRAIAQQEVFVKVYTIRIEAALAVLQERGRLGTATVVDLQRISQCLLALERLQQFTTPYDCGS